MIPCLSKHKVDRIVIDERRRKKDAVKAIPDAAVPGNDRARVLDAHMPFHQRLHEIAKRAEQGNRRPESRHLRKRHIEDIAESRTK